MMGVAVIALLVAAPARAQQAEPGIEPPAEADPPAPAQAPWQAPPQESPPPTPATKSSVEWFGWQILLADAAAVGGGVALSQRTGSPYPLMLTWSLTAPLVHGLHGDGVGVAGSLGLHVVLPIVGAFVGVRTAGPCRDYDDGGCGLGEAVAGALVGAVAATLIDAAFLSTVPRGPLPSTRSRYMAMPTIAVDPRGGGFTLGLTGRLL